MSSPPTIQAHSLFNTAKAKTKNKETQKNEALYLFDALQTRGGGSIVLQTLFLRRQGLFGRILDRVHTV